MPDRRWPRDVARIAPSRLDALIGNTIYGSASPAARHGPGGPERLPWLGRWRDLLEAGVPAVASTDHPYDDLRDVRVPSGGAMKTMSVAVTRVLAPDIEPTAWQAAQRVPVEQVLPLMTRAGAYATFEEDRKGTVTPGKLADLVVLDNDPRTVATGDLKDVRVLMTMIGGRVEYCTPGAEALCPPVG